LLKENSRNAGSRLIPKVLRTFLKSFRVLDIFLSSEIFTMIVSSLDLRSLFIALSSRSSCVLDFQLVFQLSKLALPKSSLFAAITLALFLTPVL